MKVCIGGTFDRLHKGHKALIRKAFEIDKEDKVFVGIVKDSSKSEGIANFEERKEEVLRFLKKEGFLRRAVVEPIFDRYGPSIDGEFDAIVVSKETIRTAREINELRRKKGKKPLTIICIPTVYAEDGRPISSSRIRKGEIDRDGNILRKH